MIERRQKRQHRWQNTKTHKKKILHGNRNSERKLLRRQHRALSESEKRQWTKKKVSWRRFGVIKQRRWRALAVKIHRVVVEWRGVWTRVSIWEINGCVWRMGEIFEGLIEVSDLIFFLHYFAWHSVCGKSVKSFSKKLKKDNRELITILWESTEINI